MTDNSMPTQCRAMANEQHAATCMQTFWHCRHRQIAFGKTPLIMGILNITPDSFSDGGRHFGENDAVDRANQMIEEGADILDIGGQSTRPGSKRISAQEEAARIIPVIARLRKSTNKPISVDTYSSGVARMALEAGADIINDISALRFSPDMVEVVNEYSAGLLLMHMQGEPNTMQDNPVYSDSVAEISQFLSERVSFAETRGVNPQSIALDPGIGFGKKLDHNIEILTRLEELRALGKPLLIGHSRKSFIGMVNGLPVHERDFDTVVVSVMMATRNSADIIRVHNVAIHRRAMDFVEKLL